MKTIEEIPKIIFYVAVFYGVLFFINFMQEYLPTIIERVLIAIFATVGLITTACFLAYLDSEKNE